MSDTGTSAQHPLAAWLAATDGANAAGPPPPQPVDRHESLDRGVSSRGRPTDPAGTGSPSRRRLFVLATLPWLALVTLAGAHAIGQAQPDTTPQPVASTAPAPTMPSATAPSVFAASPTATAAIAAVHAAAPTPPHTVMVESHRVIGDTTVVVVTAVGRDDQVDVAPDRYGVAVLHRNNTPIVAGTWRLPTPDDDLRWTEVSDDQLLVRASAAVAAAGDSEVSDPVLRHDSRLPDVLNLTMDAVAPGDAESGPHEVWLSGDATAVLGQPDAIPVSAPTEHP